MFLSLTNHMARNNLKEVTLAHGLRIQPIMVGKVWWQEPLLAMMVGV